MLPSTAIKPSSATPVMLCPSNAQPRITATSGLSKPSESSSHTKYEEHKANEPVELTWLSECPSEKHSKHVKPSSRNK